MTGSELAVLLLLLRGEADDGNTSLLAILKLGCLQANGKGWEMICSH
jgi:hypothetical protein